MKSKELLAEIIAELGEGDYDGAILMLAELEEYIRLECVEKSELEPEYGIVCSTILMHQEKPAEALDVIHNSLLQEPNNYELYYTSALCKEQMGDYESAYFDYKFAMYLGKDSRDYQILKKGFNHLCSYANANEYILGKCCQELIESRMELREYEETSHFLSELLYDTNEVAAKTVLSEENMLLDMMLEIVLCEKNVMEEEEFNRENTCLRYHNHVQEFKEVYLRIKMMSRRIWYGFAKQDQMELVDVLKDYPVSGDMLAVIVKYSVVQDVWIDTFRRIQEIVQEEFPLIAERMENYYVWLSNFHIGTKKKCFTPDEDEHSIGCVRIYYEPLGRKTKSGNTEDVIGSIEPVQQSMKQAAATKESSEDCECTCENQKHLDPDKIAVIYCTNDELYSRECRMYLSRLDIPEGKQLEVIEVWNSTGMAAGYNFAMDYSDARIKIYIHQDTFIIQKDALCQIVDIFENNKDVGMLGLAGTVKLADNGFWWSGCKEEIRMNLYQDAILNILKSVSVIKHGRFEDAEAMDGILLATSADIRWREEMFDGWHFYDISQCFKFRKCGYRTVLVNDSQPWLMHETTMRKDKKNLYERYRTVFVNEYMNYDFGE